MSTKTAIRRLLVIDDEENMRHMLSTVLGKGGYFVDTASDGSEGLKMIDEAHYDYVLCDIKMPKMSGMDFLKAAREKLNSTTVIRYLSWDAVSLKPPVQDPSKPPVKTATIHRTIFGDTSIPATT